MAAIKTALKAAKAALDAHNYDDAIEQAHKVLSMDSDNYFGNVFLGLALDKQDRNEDSEKAYQQAIKSKNTDVRAWQGLVTLYEKQAGKKLDKCHDAAIELASLFMEEDDKERCQIVVNKYTDFAKQHGSQQQYGHALEILLPTSLLYNYLEGRIPYPAYTYSLVAGIVEAEEIERINKEIGQRRTRLGARIDQVTEDVKREVLEASNLEELYASIINWTHDDEMRRRYEEKLLQHAYDTLLVVAPPRKPGKRARVQELAQGLVILKHPFALAWKIVLEWKDVERLEEMDNGMFKEYITHFPDDGLSKVLRGYLQSDISPFPRPTVSLEGNESEDAIIAPTTAEEQLLLMTEGVDDSPSSVLSHRIMGELYLHLDEYESAIDMARHAHGQVIVESRISGLGLTDTLDAINIILATALVRYQAPRHHGEARALFDNILKRKPENTSALMGVGLILEEQEDYAEALDFLDRAVQRNPNPKIKAEAAWCKALLGNREGGIQELEACLTEMKGADRRTKALKSETLYRIGMCIWNQDTSEAARKDRSGAYARYLSSLQADMNFAPAYTSLGIYYADYGKDKKRSRKCFQKAFELSASEVEAAERLARSFARSKEWDLVEAVAQRVVDSGKIRPAPGSRMKRVSWPFAALGVVQLNRQDYPNSIVSFQAALRAAPEDYHSWIGLGESYHNSGRYIAATKAFEQAQRIENSGDIKAVDGSWFSTYMLANVKRELGEFDAAITSYRQVMALGLVEFGVSIALLQTLVEGAWRNVELGFFGRAASSAVEAFTVAGDIAKSRGDAFNLWKAVGDACSIFYSVQAYASDCPMDYLRSLLEAGIPDEKYDILADIDGVGKDILQSLSSDNHQTSTSRPVLCLHAAILAQKRAIHCCANDLHAQAVAWYNLGWTEHRAHMCYSEENTGAFKKKTLRYLKASVQCFKRAIELEAGNAEFWNSLGIVTTELNPKVSQHSFIRSLYLNDKNAKVWTNLGTLYLIHKDLQLTNDAFTRAQSTDPDYAQAWLGQGLLASELGDPKEAHNLFCHAFEIADSSSIMVKRQYILSTFDHLLDSPVSSTSATDILQPLFAVHQLHYQTSLDLPFQHLSALFAERIGDFANGVPTLAMACSQLEDQYETSESPDLLARFAQIKTDLSRVRLAGQDFESAAESAETGLDLSDDQDSDSVARKRSRLSAHMTAGLAFYNQGSMDQALNMFRSALTETQSDPDIVCLLAQILWAKGGEEERNMAREQLFDCIEKHPNHFGAITLLCTIALLGDDHDTTEAVAADLKSLQTDESLNALQQRKLAHLLTAIATLDSSSSDQHSAEMSEATTAVMLAPSQPHGWAQLADLTEETHPAEMAVLTANKAVPPRGSLDVGHLCKAYAGTMRFDDGQRAIMVAPWMAQGWEAFSQAC